MIQIQLLELDFMACNSISCRTGRWVRIEDWSWAAGSIMQTRMLGGGSSSSSGGRDWAEHLEGVMITARASFFLWLLGYQESCMGTSSSCKLLHVRIGRFLALLLFVVVIPDLLQEVQTQRITFTEAPAKYTSNTSATFRFNLTSAANGSGNSNDTCATLCSIRCKVGRHFVDALAADQLSRLASYFCTPLSFKL